VNLRRQRVARAFGAPPCGIGLDRSARPSKSGDRPLQVRLPGTAAFLTSGAVGIPLTLTHHLKHIYALHERVLLVAVRTSEEPRVPQDERAKIQDLPAGITGVTLHYGFMDSPSVPEGPAPCSRASAA
jgi:K+ transporter